VLAGGFDQATVCCGDQFDRAKLVLVQVFHRPVHPARVGVLVGEDGFAFAPAALKTTDFPKLIVRVTPHPRLRLELCKRLNRPLLHLFVEIGDILSFS